MCVCGCHFFYGPFCGFEGKPNLKKKLCFLGPPAVPFYSFFGEGSPTEIDYRKMGSNFSIGGSSFSALYVGYLLNKSGVPEQKHPMVYSRMIWLKSRPAFQSHYTGSCTWKMYVFRRSCLVPGQREDSQRAESAACCR